jgi:hypothetical protein
VNQLANEDVPIALNLRDEILRMPNGPAIAHFLGFAPEVVTQLARMHPLDAARCIESISEDLERGGVPAEETTDYDIWKTLRNEQVGSNTRRR